MPARMPNTTTIEERVTRIDWKRDTVKGARIAVDRWFVEIEGTPAFLPGDGAAIPIGREEFLAVRHGAYVKVSELVMSADAWAGRLVFGFVLVLLLGGAVSSWAPAGFEKLAMALLIVAGIAHAAFGLYEFVRRFREVENVRASIAFALRGRIPGRLPPDDRRVRANPFPVLLAVTTFLFLAWLFSADVLQSAGLGRFAGAADAAFLTMVVATALFGTANWSIEARRKSRE